MGSTTFSGNIRSGGNRGTVRGSAVLTIESKVIKTDVVAGEATATVPVVAFKLPGNSYVKSCIVIADPDNTMSAGSVDVGVVGSSAALANDIMASGVTDGGVIASPTIGAPVGADDVDVIVTPAVLTDGNTIIRLEYWVYDSKNGEV